MRAVTIWIVIGPSLKTLWDIRKAAAAAGDPYNGPMDDTTYAILNTAESAEIVQEQYNTKTVQGQTPFTLFNMMFKNEQETADAIEWLDSEWPGKQYETQSAWYYDNGLQVGLSYTRDDDGNITGTTGTPTYPLLDDAWQVMKAPASSNADLRDENLAQGQTARIFD